MKDVAQRVLDAGNPNELLTERGSSFGYNTLVSDFRGLPTMARDTGLPIIVDATHSVQQPGGQGATSGGQGEMVPTLSRAAIAVGVAEHSCCIEAAEIFIFGKLYCVRKHVCINCQALLAKVLNAHLLTDTTIVAHNTIIREHNLGITHARTKAEPGTIPHELQEQAHHHKQAHKTPTIPSPPTKHSTPTPQQPPTICAPSSTHDFVFSKYSLGVILSTNFQ
mgnify:CR=1 FL=1